MRKFTVSILVVLLLPALAAAAGLKVQSGEHDGFTRLVLPLPAGAAWEVRKNHHSVEIRIPSSGAEFDITQVFKKISRDRISDIRELGQSAGLVLDLACTCAVSSFVEPGNYLVVDIKDTKAEQPSRVSYSILPQNTPAYRFPSSRQSPEPRKSETPAVEQPSSKNGEGGIARISRKNSMTESMFTELGLAKAWRRKLRQRIEDATSSGLLNVRSGEDPENKARPTASKDERPRSAGTQPTERDLDQVPQPKSPGTHVSVKSAVQVGIGTTPFEQAEKAKCRDSHRVDISSWAASEDFSAQIGSRLPGLFSESGEIAKKEAIDLARTYLFFGLGAEAAAIVDPLPDSDPDVQAVRAIAELLQNTDARGEYFAGQASCNTVSAMWAAIATINKHSKVNTKAVLQAFSKLPLHLRDVLGPTLATRLEEAGDVSAAGVVTRLLNHSPDRGVTSVSREMSHDTENHELVGYGRSEDLEGTNALSAARAVIALIDNKKRSRKPVSKELVELVSSFVVEFRGSALEPELLRTQAIALSLAGDFRAAMHIVGLDRPTAEAPDNFTDAQLEVLTLLVEGADDIVFLQYALPLTNSQISALPTALREAMAYRLADLGLDVEARNLMITEALGDHSDTGKLAEEDPSDPGKINSAAQGQKANNGLVAQTSHDLGEEDPVPARFPAGSSDRFQSAMTGFGGERDLSEIGKLPPLAHARRLLRQSALLRNNLRSITGGAAGSP